MNHFELTEEQKNIVNNYDSLFDNLFELHSEYTTKKVVKMYYEYRLQLKKYQVDMLYRQLVIWFIGRKFVGQDEMYKLIMDILYP